MVCDLWIHELAGAGDLEPLAQVCYRYVSGLDDEAIAYVAESCRMLRAEVDRRGPALKALPREVRPDGKLTRELAAQRRLRLRPIVATFDEIQNAIMHPEYGAQIAEDLAYVERLGRKLGIFIILSTQRPDNDALPPKIRDLATVRFCLKVPDQVSNDMILGTGSYKAGYRASRVPAEDRRRARLVQRRRRPPGRPHLLPGPERHRADRRPRPRDARGRRGAVRVRARGEFRRRRRAASPPTC